MITRAGNANRFTDTMPERGYMKSAIEQEIEWCEAHMGESANGVEFEKGFIAGLKQALRFEKAVEQMRAADETICACSHDKYENPNKPGHCMACGKPFRR